MITIEVDRYVDKPGHIKEAIHLSSDELLEIVENSGDLAPILEAAIGPLLDDLYINVKGGHLSEASYFFDKIYQTLDRPLPQMYDDVAWGQTPKKDRWCNEW